VSLPCPTQPTEKSVGRFTFVLKMRAISIQLLSAIARARDPLQAFSDAEAATRPTPGKWSPKEIIGHLIDSAANNHQRFVRAQQGLTDLLPYRYAQEHWVKTQDYQSAQWPHLIVLWQAYNIHLAHVIAHIQPAFLEQPLLAWSDEPVTLRCIAEDYVQHLQHHLRQIFTLSDEPAAPGFHFQKLSIDDLELLQQIGRDSYEPYYSHVWHPGGLEWYMEHCFGTQTLQRDFADPNIAYWIVTDQQAQALGFLKLVLQKELPEAGIENALYLEKIYLLPTHFGKGAGQKIIEWVMSEAAKRGRDAVWLNVMKTGPVGSYERAGFRTVGETRFEFEWLKTEERAGWIMVRTV